jgi:hypothetical protein
VLFELGSQLGITVRYRRILDKSVAQSLNHSGEVASPPLATTDLSKILRYAGLPSAPSLSPLVCCQDALSPSAHATCHAPGSCRYAMVLHDTLELSARRMKQRAELSTNFLESVGQPVGCGKKSRGLVGRDRLALIERKNTAGDVAGGMRAGAMTTGGVGAVVDPRVEPGVYVAFWHR